MSCALSCTPLPCHPAHTPPVCSSSEAKLEDSFRLPCHGWVHRRVCVKEEAMFPGAIGESGAHHPTPKGT